MSDDSNSKYIIKPISSDLFRLLFAALSFAAKILANIVFVKSFSALFADDGILWLSHWQNACAFVLTVADESISKYLIAQGREKEEKYAGFLSFVVMSLILSLTGFALALYFDSGFFVRFYSPLVALTGIFSVLLFSVQQSLLFRQGKAVSAYMVQTIVSVLIFTAAFFAGDFLPFLLIFPYWVGLLLSIRNFYPDMSRPILSLAELKGIFFLLSVSFLTACADKIGEMFFRREVFSLYGAGKAANWEALLLFGGYYKAFWFFFFQVYLLPLLCEKREHAEKKNLKITLKAFLGICAFFLILLIAGEPIFVLLLGEKVTGFRDLLPVVYAGDFGRFCGILLSLLLLSRNQIRLYSVSQMIILAVWLAISFFALKSGKIENLVYANVMSGFFAFLFNAGLNILFRFDKLKS